MPDNVKVQAGTGNDTVSPPIATDLVGGQHYQRVKAGWGVDGVWNETADTDGNRIPVKVGMPTLTIAHTAPTPGTSSGTLIAGNSSRRYLLLQNIGSVDVDIKIAAAAVVGQGIRLYANGGFYEMSTAMGNYAEGAINGIVASGTGTVLVTEGTGT